MNIYIETIEYTKPQATSGHIVNHSYLETKSGFRMRVILIYVYIFIHTQFIRKAINLVEHTGLALDRAMNLEVLIMHG